VHQQHFFFGENKIKGNDEYAFSSMQNISRMSTNWQQIWSENVSRLTSTALPFYRQNLFT